MAIETDGGLALSMDDLAAAFATSYRWIPAADALRLDTRAEAEFPAVNGADGVNSRYRVTLEDGQIVFHYPDGHTASVADGTYPYCEDAFYVSDIASAAAVFDEEGLCLRVSTSHDEGATWTVAEISLSDLTPPDAEVRDFYLDIYPQSVWMGYTSEQAGWIVLTTYYGMANGKQILFRTDDGGMTWSRVHDSPWRRYAVGAGFATPERGWISLLMADDPLTVWYTDDGGATWSLYDLMQFVPASLRAGVMEAASPVFDGERGRWQVYVRRTDGYNTLEQYMLWLVTNDGGETWYCENPTEWVE